MANGRCRFHGGKSTGPRTDAGAERSRQAGLRYGFYTEAARRERHRLGGAAWLARAVRGDGVMETSFVGPEITGCERETLYLRPLRYGQGCGLVTSVPVAHGVQQAAAPLR